MNLKFCYFIIFIILFLNFNLGYLFSNNAYKVNSLNNPAPGYLMMEQVSSLIDNYGLPVFEDSLNFGSNSFKLLKNGFYVKQSINDYYLYDKNLKAIDTIINPTSYIIDPHDIISLSNGHYLLLCTENLIMDLSKVIDGGNSKANVISNVLVETDTKGNLFWQWRAIDHTNIKDVADETSLAQFTIDFTHINSMDEDDNGNILISIRHFDEVSLINKSTGNFIWRIGGSKSKNNQYSFTNDTYNDFFGFSHQHCASILPNGNILLYDNGNLKPNPYSRVVEYNINEISKTIEKVWEYRYSPDIYNSTFGTVYRLENGNTLINFSNGKVVEVKPDKSIAFEINSLLNDVYYRVQKSTLNAVYSKKVISDTGIYNFNNNPDDTGIKLYLTKATGKSTIYIQKHNYAPPNGDYADSSFSNILPVRWVITSDDKVNIEGRFILNVNSLKNIPSPDKVVIYKRNREAAGIFEKLNTSYNSFTSEISASFTGFGEFVLAINAISKPKLIFPVNSSTIDTTGNLIWSKSVGAIKYMVQISDSKDFTKIIKSNFVNKSPITFYNNLLYDKNYFWRVKAFSNSDSSMWSDISYFSTISALIKISLLQPQNDMTKVDTNCKFEWSKNLDADFYNFQLSNTESFDIIIHEESKSTENFITINNLKSNEQYFWRVSFIKNSIVSEWSKVWHFVTLSKNVLPVPELNFPENNKTAVSINDELTWKAVKGADKYQISISEREDFNSTIIHKFDYSEMKYSYSGLKYNTIYYWRVSAFNDSSQSNWSEIRKFVTELEPPDIIFPVNNSENLQVIGLIKWEINNDLYSYNLQISRNIEFNDNIVDSIEIEERKYEYKLDENLEYYSRVKTYNDTNKSRWSNIVKFKTVDLSSVEYEENTSLVLFPNPVSDILKFKLKYSEFPILVNIYDLNGYCVFCKKYFNTNFLVDVSNLDCGLYLFTINYINEKNTLKCFSSKSLFYKIN